MTNTDRRPEGAQLYWAAIILRSYGFSDIANQVNFARAEILSGAVQPVEVGEA